MIAIYFAITPENLSKYMDKTNYNCDIICFKLKKERIFVGFLADNAGDVLNKIFEVLQPPSAIKDLAICKATISEHIRFN